jgi:acyl-CoA thioester hydrolase
MIAHLQDIPPDGRHRYQVRVYYEDTDAGGVVYHANYLRFAERARTEALRAVGIPHSEMVGRFALMFMVRRIEVDYLRPARPDESLCVETEVQAVGGATVLLRQAVHGPAGLCADLRVRLACVQTGGNKPGRIPPRWRETLAAMHDAGRPAGGTQTDDERRD